MSGQSKVALITAADSAFGTEIAHELARMGFRVVLAGDDAAALNRAAGSLQTNGTNVLSMPLDVAEAGAPQLVAEELEDQGYAVDTLINAAAVAESSSLLQVKPNAFRRLFETNFFGVLWTCQAFVPGMLARGYGRVVNVGYVPESSVAIRGGVGAYVLSLEALNAFTVTLAGEVCEDVKVNAVCLKNVIADDTTRGRRPMVEQVARLATLPGDGPNGVCFLRNTDGSEG